jgi:nitroimidazol reductase NimA-like FMN-containing flavoprotein (pyridoxamine 5'-phosphate oxidase superfamily)
MTEGARATYRFGMGQMVELTRDECLELLARTRFGRIAVSGSDPTPTIRPINYAFDVPTQSVVFRTGRGSKFHALLRAAHAAFEIDEVDDEGATGWSVIVAGAVEEIVNLAELERIAGAVQSWEPSDKPYWLRLRAFTVTGRRIVAATGDNVS